MNEDKVYDVTLTLILHTRQSFGPTERERPITRSDAIDNVIGGDLSEVIRTAESYGFTVALPIEGTAEEVASYV